MGARARPSPRTDAQQYGGKAGAHRRQRDGRKLTKNLHKHRCLFGCVSLLKVHPSASSIKIRTSDDVAVNVAFDDPLDQVPQGWVQVWGSVVGPNALSAQDLWQFGDQEDPTSETFGTHD